MSPRPYKNYEERYRHPVPPVYREGGSKEFAILQPRAYIARNLMNRTVGSFYDLEDTELTDHQRRAKEEFIRLFEAQAKCPTEDLHITLRSLMGNLDDFFFFGSLTRGSLPLIKEFKLTHFSKSESRLGHCRSLCDDKGLPQFEVVLGKEREQRLATLAELVLVLVHELTHAFLFAFICYCPRCQKNRINAAGIENSGHGPVFRGVNYSAMVCLSKWNAELERVFRTYTHDSFIDGPSLILEQMCIEEARLNGDLVGSYGYIQNPSPKQLICVTENSVTIDTERLRKNVGRRSVSTGAEAILSAISQLAMNNPTDDLDDENISTANPSAEGFALSTIVYCAASIFMPVTACNVRYSLGGLGGFGC
ncbi:hypothetical protein F5Y19DRAFT_491171 [Xylariaceae sp. FL1651]|nr:hypothetical protein F5Y19DRAFT_491171 [Xylariaceae sp. FL1651]